MIEGFAPLGDSVVIAVTETDQRVTLPALPGANPVIRLISKQANQVALWVKLGTVTVTGSVTASMRIRPGSVDGPAYIAVGNSETHLSIFCEGPPGTVVLTVGQIVDGSGLDANPQFTTIELGDPSDTTLSRSSAGVIAVEGVPIYSNIPQNSQSAAYTAVLADAQKHLLHPAADNNARTFTIDSNANVAYPIGTAITFVNQINTVTIAITSDTMTLAGAGTTGSRTLAANGIATALKIASTAWMISGTGLT